jgi:hypothetical protein
VIQKMRVHLAGLLGLAALASGCACNTAPVNINQKRDSGSATVIDAGKPGCDSISNAWKAQDLQGSASIQSDAAGSFASAANLFGIWGSGSDSIFVVGSKGRVLHYDGKTWKSQTTPTSQDLWSVWGTSSTSVWASGFYGTVLHYDGTTWTADPPDTKLFNYSTDGSMPTGDAGIFARSNLYGIFAFINGTGDDVYTVGNHGLVLHKTGGKWSYVSSGVEEDLHGVWGPSLNRVFIVGDYGTILVGTTSLSKQSTGSDKPLRGVWGRSGSDVYVVGLTGTIIHYNGSAWTALDGAPKQNLRAIWGPQEDSTTTYIVGWDGTLMRMTGGPSYTKGATFDAYNCITSNRLEGIWGTTRASVNPVDAGITEVSMWVCGVSGTILKGP